MRLSFTLAGVATLAACTAGSTGAPPITQVNPTSPTYSKLQFAVGTANLYGTSVGLNVVATLRQPNGQSATGVNTPNLTGPFSFTAANAPAVGTNSALLVNPYTTSSLSDVYTTVPDGGPSIAETTGTPHIGGTSQSVAPGTPFCDYTGSLPANANSNDTFTACPSGYTPDASTFGQSGGVFALGLAPFNHAASTGQAASYAPYPQPFFDASTQASQPSAPRPPLIPWGGPPAFDPDHDGMGTRDGLFPAGTDSFNQNYFLGVAEGITAFAGVTPQAGTYTLAVAIGTLGNNGTPNVGTLTASARLGSTAALPALTTPLVTPDANGDGGATFAVTLPSGVTEAYVQIVDYGPSAGPSIAYAPAANGAIATQANCQGPKGTSFAPVYYTVHVTASGTYQLPAVDGPNTNLTGGTQNLTPSPSICTAAQNIAAKVTDPSGNAVTAGDNFTVQMVGFDYPIYAAALGLTQTTPPQAPQIAGPNGRADLTLSAPVEEDYGAAGYSVTPLSGRRVPIVRHRAGRPAPRVLSTGIRAGIGI